MTTWSRRGQLVTVLPTQGGTIFGLPALEVNG